MNPKISVAIDTISTPTRIGSRSDFRINVWKNAISAMPMTGTPEPSNHTIMVRPMMPGVSRRGGGPASSA